MKNRACSFTTKFILLLFLASAKFSMAKQEIPSSVNQFKTHPKKNIKYPDPVLVSLAIVIFSLLVYMAYSMFTFLSIIAILFAGSLAFYNIAVRVRSVNKQFSYGKRNASFYSIIILILPFIFGTIIAFDGFINFMSITQTVFVWTLTLSFWQTMLFVPLAIRSAYRDSIMPEPKIYPHMTVLIPAHNEEKVLERTIESLLEAEYPKKEVIVIDDGSTDHTLEVAKRYKNKIKILHKENGGKASALNHGLLFAKGEIIVIVDADTIVGRKSLTSIAKGLGDKTVAAVAGNIKIRNKVNWITWCQALEYLSGIQIMRRALDYFGAITIVPGALGIFRKHVLEEAGSYHKDTLVEDFDATIKVLKSGLVVQGSSEAVAYTQAPQTFRDFYRQRKRWYRGNLQVLSRHSDALTNPRFGLLQKFVYPLMAIHMLLIPTASIVVWAFAAYQVILGNYQFVAFMVGMYIALQYLLSAMAIRMDSDDKRILLFSVFLVIGFKQLTDILQLKAVMEELFQRKTIWTRANRIRS